MRLNRLCLVAATIVMLGSVYAEPKEQKAANAWSEEKVERALKQSRPVLVVFTADWCVTCQVNKVRVFENAEVVKFLKDQKIEVLMADFTKKDEKVGQAMKELGATAVPLTVLYVPGREQPVVLDEALTPEVLMKTVDEALADER